MCGKDCVWAFYNSNGWMCRNLNRADYENEKRFPIPTKCIGMSKCCLYFSFRKLGLCTLALDCLAEVLGLDDAMCDECKAKMEEDNKKECVQVDEK